MTAIVRLAARQHGLVTRSQLRALGLPASAVDFRLRTGRLHRVHRGVYAVGYPSPAPDQRMMAAVLACGPQAALSHRSAAELWEIGPACRGAAEVTAVRQTRVSGVITHRTRSLTGDVTVHRAIRVTTVVRTLLDLSRVLDEARLRRAINDARIRHLVSPAQLRSRLAHLLGPDAPTRSEFEDLFLAFLRDHGLPRSEVNQRVAGHEVDALWRDRRLVVELDSRTFHDGPIAFERDRERDADLLAAGFRVVRITWRRLTTQGPEEAARLRALLGAHTAEI